MEADFDAAPMIAPHAMSDGDCVSRCRKSSPASRATLTSDVPYFTFPFLVFSWVRRWHAARYYTAL